MTNEQRSKIHAAFMGDALFRATVERLYYAAKEASLGESADLFISLADILLDYDNGRLDEADSLRRRLVRLLSSQTILSPFVVERQPLPPAEEETCKRLELLKIPGF